MEGSDVLKKPQLGMAIWMMLSGMIFFLAIAWWYQTNGAVGFDLKMIRWMAAVRREWLTVGIRAVTGLGSVIFIVSAGLVITAVGIWKRFNGRDLLLFNLNNVTGIILMQLLKAVFGRERPPLPWLGTASGFSFPSGHTLMATVFYGSLSYWASRNKGMPGRKFWAVGLGCLPLLVGFSRVYLGVHYASDVLAGWAAGIAWVGVWIGRLSKD